MSFEINSDLTYFVENSIAFKLEKIKLTGLKEAFFWNHIIMKFEGRLWNRVYTKCEKIDKIKWGLEQHKPLPLVTVFHHWNPCILRLSLIPAPSC